MTWFRNNQIQGKLIRSKSEFRGSRLGGLALIMLCLGPLAGILYAWPLQMPTHESLEADGLENSKTGPSEVANSAKAETLFHRYCSRCHGSEGRGMNKQTKMPEIPDFTNSSWQKKKSNSQLEVSILEGKGKSMPAFADRLKEEEVQALVAHIRGLCSSDFAPPISTASEFDNHYRQLQEELDQLRQQFRELSDRSRKPRK